MASSAANIKINPVNVTWVMEQTYSITTVADVAGSLDGTYFLLSDTAGSVAFWFDVDDSGTTIPAGASAADRAIEITTIVTGDSAANVAAKITTAIAADSEFSSKTSGNVATPKSTATADIADWADGDTGFTFVKCFEGRNFDLGLLEGDLEMSHSEETAVITAHQTGTTPRGALRTGNSVEFTTILQETTFSNLKEFFGRSTGGTFTPSGGTELFGQGRSRQGTNVLVESGRLVLKPVNAVDDSENVTIFRAYPNPESLVFSGENPQTLTVSWTAFDAEDLDGNISLFAFGDQTQNGVDPT